MLKRVLGQSFEQNCCQNALTMATNRRRRCRSGLSTSKAKYRTSHSRNCDWCWTEFLTEFLTEWVCDWVWISRQVNIWVKVENLLETFLLHSLPSGCSSYVLPASWPLREPPELNSLKATSSLQGSFYAGDLLKLERRERLIFNLNEIN